MRLNHLFRPRDVVVSSLAGGLGNQLFQYAFGRAIALKHGCRLVLDTRILHIKEGQTAREYALDAFNVQAEIDTLSIGQLNRCVAIKEPASHCSHDAEAATVPGCRLTGYWQTEKYFAHIRPDLLRDLTLLNPVTTYIAELADQIRQSQSVSVHFRRGDYVTDTKIAAIHGLCDPDYHLRAIRCLQSRQEGLHFFLFSDDPAWLRANVPTDIHATIVDADRSSAREDLWLMSLCKHHIIANSSFSWWGAWLGAQDGITFAPRRWFLSPSLTDTDIVPDRWQRI